MDKNIIKKHLTERFLSEGPVPGITVTDKAKKESGKINKAGVKDIEKDVKDFEKVTKAGAEKMAQNKFNYTDDKEIKYHDEVEIRNGQEMIEYDGDPAQSFKDRAKEGIEGSSRMGNNPEWANVVQAGQGGDPTFGKNLVKTIKAATKARNDADYNVISFGDDIEQRPKSEKPKGKHSAIAEGETEKASRDIESGKPYGTDKEREFYDSDDAKSPLDKKEKPSVNEKHDEIDSAMAKARIGITSTGPSKFAVEVNGNQKIFRATRESAEEAKDKLQKELPNAKITIVPITENKDNKKPQIQKESMKRLKFTKDFNGVGNALKLIPESYRTDNKEFEMTDGNETYRIRWEGTLSEGKAVVLAASNKTMVNEDMQRMKHLMGYKSEDTLGLVRGKSRIDENAVFGDIWNKSKVLLEGEEIEGQSASKGEWDKVKKTAKEATKDIEGSTSDDKGTKAPKAKSGTMDSFDKAKSHAPEAKKHVEGSVDAEIGMGLGEQEEGEGAWDEISMPQAAAHGNPSKTAYAPAPKTGEWDKVSVPQAADAKKHVNMHEGLVLNGILFEPIELKKKK
jgi:hypothetical protein